MKPHPLPSLHLAAASLAALLLATSCASFKWSPVYLPAVSPAAQVATGAFLKSDTAAQREAKAQILLRVAQAIRTVPGTKPTRQDVYDRLMATVPATPLWTALSGSLADLYETSVKDVPEDISAYAAILARIAIGIEAAVAESALPTK